VSVGVDAGAFQNYGSGVLTSACGTSINHAILAVGYGTANGVQYFKLKNSWGTSWGEAGYGRLGRGDKYNGGAGQCGLYLMMSYPTQPDPHA